MPNRTAIRALGRAGFTAAMAAGVGLLVASARPRRYVEEAAPAEPPAGLPPARIVHVPGRGEMFVREAPGPQDASAPTILLLHGWMFPADLNWFACYGPLSEVARVIAVDHRGHGRGPRPTQPFRLRDVADDAAALVRHLGVGPVIAVGYSMGGPVAQLLWRRNRDVVAGLVLGATSDTFNDTSFERWRWRLMGVLQVLLRVVPRAWWEAGAELQAREGSRMVVTRLITSETSEELRALIPWVVAELDRGSAEDIAEAGRELSRYEARDWIGELDVPAAVLVTARDRLVPPERQRDLAARIGGFVQELPLDHDGVGSRPDLFVPALLKAVDSVQQALLDGGA